MSLKTREQSAVEHEGKLSLGLILNDQLLFNRFFAKSDLSEEPSIKQKLMMLDKSRRVMDCTSRNVGKSVNIKLCIMRDLITHQRSGNTDQKDEILVCAPTEGHLDPLVNNLFSDIFNNVLFRSMILHSSKGDKPLLQTRTGLWIYFRLEGTSGDGRNMVALHPYKVYGDEMAYGGTVDHRYRIDGAQPDAMWRYSGVPNDVRSSPFYSIDQSEAGESWSKHHLCLLYDNPLFTLGTKAQVNRRRKEKIREHGGEDSPSYKTQVLGQWGAEAASSFPPGSVSWASVVFDDEGNPQRFPYHISDALQGPFVTAAIKQNTLPSMLKIPTVRCTRAVIGWDYGYSPDPTTFLVAIQTTDNIWRTYCRIQLFRTSPERQVDVLKFIVQSVLENKVQVISTDSQTAYHECMNDTNRHIFANILRLSNPGGTIHLDTDTGEFIHPDDIEQPQIQMHLKTGRIVKQGRKYFLTEMFRRYMNNAIQKREASTRLVLGDDPILENELVGTIERKMPTTGRVVYDLPLKGKGSGRIMPDQIVDAARYMVDAISVIDKEGFLQQKDYSGLFDSMGWVKRRNVTENWTPPWIG